jgi:hypothetical protein
VVGCGQKTRFRSIHDGINLARGSQRTCEARISPRAAAVVGGDAAPLQEPAAEREHAQLSHETFAYICAGIQRPGGTKETARRLVSNRRRPRGQREVRRLKRGPLLMNAL